jgi:hypothetical chaperone protein
MNHAIGVDFGTSNSTAGLAHAGLLPLEDGKATLPSVVFFNAEDEQVTYGRAALADYLAGYEGRLMRSLKSLLGTSLMDGQTEVAGRALPFRDLLAQFIGELKRRAEQAAGQPFSQAVIGRPVFFVDDDAQADRLAEQTLRDIAHAAGFRDVAFQFEPIAAAFDYESRIAKEELVLIADIGGGTSDFTLVRLAPGRKPSAERRDDILATGGVHIGGTDFDKYLSLAQVMPLLGLGGKLSNGSEVPSGYYFNLATWHTINLVYTRKAWQQLADLARDAADKRAFALLRDLVEQRAGHWLAMRVEEGKIALSGAEQAELVLDRLAPDLALTLTRPAFDAAVLPLVDSVGATVTRMLADAGVAADAVDTIFFTGGSSGVPLLRERVARLLPRARRVEGDLFGSIGTGLGLAAAHTFA